MKTVTRQLQWPNSGTVVEISDGGLDYANSDTLAKKYPGEMEEYTNPVEAVEAAIAIAQAWQKDEPDQKILIDHGATGGDSMPFDGTELNEETFKYLRDWATKLLENMPQCEHCGEMLGGDTFSHTLNDGKFCSENCARQDYNFCTADDPDEYEED